MVKKNTQLFIFVVASIAGFGGFLIGFDASVMADIHDLVTRRLHLSDWQWAQLVSISLLGNPNNEF